MQNAIINVNGQLLPAQQAKVAVMDRGYLYGDSLYEVARSYNGKFLYLEEHLERLERSAELCRMVLGQTRDQYRSEIQRTFEAFRNQPGMAAAEAYCRIIVSRGAGRIGFGLACLQTPTLFCILVQPLDPVSEEQRAKGLKLKVVSRIRNDRRALDPAMKSGNYLNNLLAYLEATNEGFDDALLCDSEDHITEGTTFNIFYVRRGIIATPPLPVGILVGITRKHVLEVASSQGIPTREVLFPPARLHEADEVFVTSSLREVFPVRQVDQHSIGRGGAGPITRRLQEAFREVIDKECP